MTYFANSTEAATFQRRWCTRCRNWRDRSGEEGYPAEGAGCPVMDLHFLHGPEAATDEHHWLHSLIRDASVAGERRCLLFVLGRRRELLDASSEAEPQTMIASCSNFTASPRADERKER